MDLVHEGRRNLGKRGANELDAIAAATSLARAQQVVLGRINQALAEYSLTFSRYEALALLSFTREGSMAMARMGERLQVHPTSVTSTIDRLERDGLVERKPHPDDRRATLVALTAGGRRALDRATTALEGIRWGMGDVAGGELQAIVAALVPVRASAGDDTSRSELTTAKGTPT